jgi:hypothetical protein
VFLLSQVGKCDASPVNGGTGAVQRSVDVPMMFGTAIAAHPAPDPKTFQPPGPQTPGVFKPQKTPGVFLTQDSTTLKVFWVNWSAA